MSPPLVPTVKMRERAEARGDDSLPLRFVGRPLARSLSTAGPGIAGGGTAFVSFDRRGISNYVEPEGCQCRGRKERYRTHWP